MTWNYRIIKDKDYYTVCEVFYNDNGKPHSWSEPIDIGGESTDEILEQLLQMIKDINQKVLEVRNNKLYEI